MKRILLCAALLSCLISACKEKDRSAEGGQAGVYELKKQTLTGGGKDSTIKRDQVKIYTDRNFVYASMTPDSSVGFGVGAYTLDSPTRITEHNFYTSRALDSTLTYSLVIEKTNNGYKQTIPDYTTAQGQKYVLKEEYKRMPAKASAPLDGLWKMERTYTVKGTDTVESKVRQYKIYWQGHFIFIHRFPQDSAGTKFKNGFGTGEYTFRNDTLREEEKKSNYALLRGHKFTVKITRNGDDEYTQVINSAQNGESVEIYRRVK
jgi:hypothetical protein